MKVSVIIPCYNVADFIEECIMSVAGQTHKDIEIICIDNDSKDDSLRVLRRLENEYEGLIVAEEKTPGAPAARNHGLRMSKGEWIQFLDADDILLPDKISGQLSLLGDHHRPPFVVGAYRRLDMDTGAVLEVLPNERPWHGLITNRLGITSANLFSRDSLMEVDGFDESLKSSQEYDLMFRLMMFVDDPICSKAVQTVIRSRTTGSISSGDIAGNKHRFLRLTARIAAYLRLEFTEEYVDLGEEWRQAVFIRIHLNAVDGLPDSPSLYRDILPADFRPEEHPFLPAWFRMTMRLFGYRAAEGIRSAMSP